MDEAVEAFENHDYLKSLQLLIDALDCDFRERYGNPEGTSFRIPHGSIVVRINITPETLHISADFLRLPEKGRVAMLRQIAEMNINNLMLARFVKSGDYLKMEYSCPLTDTHPHKIHAIIHNICLIGDKYDDELCTRFNADGDEHADLGGAGRDLRRSETAPDDSEGRRAEAENTDVRRGDQRVG